MLTPLIFEDKIIFRCHECNWEKPYKKKLFKLLSSNK